MIEQQTLTPEMRRSVRAMVCAFQELNAIRARDGAPTGVAPEWFSQVVDMLDASVTELTGRSAHCHPLLYKSE